MLLLGAALTGPACHAPESGHDGSTLQGSAADGRAADSLGALDGTRARGPADDDRMAWWRDARFGLFIHWGLYSVLEGEWQGATGHAEWIRTTAQIPREEYATLVERFDPVAYDADTWCRMAKDAGMKYVVITTKHHDGFCLWPSDATTFDVDATPSGRDLLGELAAACRRHDLRIGWYHSIMDWNHPDYLPRRGWEDDRSTEGADFDRYVAYLRTQVKELLTEYGPIDVMWFDGEWEATWTSEYGRALYALCRELQPQVIVNNRVDKGRAGMAGLDTGPGFAGDFGTPEQEVPPTGLPGIDWETCMTMNRYWGWNRADEDWKSPTTLVQTLVDVASKGGNFLLNVGPRPDGSFPSRAVDRLAAIGDWMEVYGESIHGTEASPFAEQLPWGRCTTKRRADGGTTLYLHVFDWPSTPQLKLPKLGNREMRVHLLGAAADPRYAELPRVDEAGRYELSWQLLDDGVQFFVPKVRPEHLVNVIAVELEDAPIVFAPPVIAAEAEVFLDELEVDLGAPSAGLVVRFTLDGSAVTRDSRRARGSLTLKETTTVSARSFFDGRPVGEPVTRTFTRLEPQAAVDLPTEAAPGGLRARSWNGAFEKLPEPIFLADTPDELGIRPAIPLTEELDRENLLVEHTGWLHVPETALYRFALTSDDGSKLWLHDEVVVDHDGLHGASTRTGDIALAAGWHPVSLRWFNRTGSATLDLQWAPLGEAPRRPNPGEFAAD